MSIERKVITALKWTATAKLFGQVASWIVTLVIVRLLSPADYGLMALATVIITVTSSLAELGVGASIVQARSLESNELSNLAGIVVALNLAMGLAVVVLAPVAGAAFEEPRLADVIRVCAIQFVFSAFGGVPQALASREMNFKWLAQIELACGVVASASTLVLAHAGTGVWALVAGANIGGGMRTLLLLLTGRRVKPVFRFKGMHRHLRFGSAITLSRLSWLVIYQSDVLIAGRYLAQDAVGMYSVSLHLATLPMQKIMGVINQVTFPAMSRLQDDLPRLRERLLQGVHFLTFVSVPLLWGLSAVAPEFVRIVLGPAWEPSITPLQVISLIVPLRMLSGTLFTSVSSLGKAGTDLRNTAVNAFVLPSCFLVGVPWGPEGLAFAWLVAMPIVMSMNFPRLTVVVGIRLRHVLDATLGPLVAGGAMWVGVFAARYWLVALTDSWRLPLLVLTGGATYVVVVTILDRRIWKNLLRVCAHARG